MAYDYSQIDIDVVLKRTYDALDDEQRSMVGKGRASGYLAVGAWMGTGKTVVSLTTVLCFKPQVVMIICPKNAISTFRNEIQKWYPELSSLVVVGGSEGERWSKWGQAKTSKGPLFYITTGGAFMRDFTWLVQQKIFPDAIITDESKRLGFSNHKSKTWKLFKSYVYDYKRPKIIVQLAGKLTSKGPQQIWPYLHIADRKVFRGFWPFINTFHLVFPGAFGREIGPPQNTEAFAQAISPYVSIITKKQADKGLPPMRRQKLYAQMDPLVIDMYNSMAKELYMSLPDGRVDFVSNPLAAMARLRKLICCPKIIDPNLPYGGAIEAVVEKMLEDKEDSEDPNWYHNIVYTPFLESIPHFRQYLSQSLNRSLDSIMVLQGGDSADYINAVETRFRADQKTMILCSLMFAQSFNLETCQNVYFPHFDWDPEINEQAEARGRRRTSRKDRIFNAFYVEIEGSITADIFERMSDKERVNNLTFAAVERLKERLRTGIKKNL